MRAILVRRIRMEGFIVSDHMELWPEAIGELAALAAAKKLTWRETIRGGLENAPQALVDLPRARTSASCG
jgi:NADPH-dependent curcumin reductase CurA